MSCACGKPVKVKGKCKSCYNIEYGRKLRAGTLIPAQRRVGTMFYEFRIGRNILRSDIAKALGVTTTYIGRMERGDCKINEKYHEYLSNLFQAESSEFIDVDGYAKEVMEGI